MKTLLKLAVLAVALAASGCATRYQEAALAGGAVGLGVGRATVGSGGGYAAQPRQPVVPMGATVVPCQRPEPAGTVCYAFLNAPSAQTGPVAPRAHLDGTIVRETGRKAVVLRNGCKAGEKLPDPLPMPEPGKTVEVNCVPM